jgi:Protein of unknown function (DUF2804)
VLPPIPSAPVDALGAPHFGSYCGAFDTVDLTGLAGGFRPSLGQKLTRRKKWHYGFVATEEVAAMWAVADLRYLASAFTMAVDLKTGIKLIDTSLVAPPSPLACVSDAPMDGSHVRFASPRGRFSVNGSAQGLAACVQLGGLLPTTKTKLRLDCVLHATHRQTPLTVIAPVEGGIVNVTTKLVGLEATGTLAVGTRTYSLAGAVGGFDHTHGYLARTTAWRWALVSGRLASGEAFGINLVEGFNEGRDDVNENAVWSPSPDASSGAELTTLGRARFEFSKDPMAVWRVTTTDESLEMTFKPLAVHREDKDFGWVRSSFVQPMGLWSGWVKLRGQKMPFANAPGVAENQNMRW